jgi:hypothetical protein
MKSGFYFICDGRNRIEETWAAIQHHGINKSERMGGPVASSSVR